MRSKSFIIGAVVGLVLLGSAFTFYSYVLAPSQHAESRQVTLYFANSQVTQVAPEKRVLSVEVTPEAIVFELIKGPQTADLFPTIPQGTRLLSVKVADRIAYVNFSREAKDNHSGGSAAELMLVYSVVASLTELPEVAELQFLLEGVIEPSIWGHMNTDLPIPPDDNFIAR
ncbi:MAG: Lipoprotein LpqB GerMN domain-containing protein [Bacillota bacterium]|nr:MAG: Lipoprotein LpqB GerMN domain-containing protein [Bacillota bacterium]MBS3951167.1 GerMN domain-containing protein [Peptococcaceae bacterium]